MKDCDDTGEIVTVAYAREEESKKGMDSSQVTGAASSYARKYALENTDCTHRKFKITCLNFGWKVIRAKNGKAILFAI